MCISNKFPSNASAAGPGNTLENTSGLYLMAVKLGSMLEAPGQFYQCQGLPQILTCHKSASGDFNLESSRTQF